MIISKYRFFTKNRREYRLTAINAVRVWTYTDYKSGGFFKLADSKDLNLLDYDSCSITPTQKNQEIILTQNKYLIFIYANATFVN